MNDGYSAYLQLDAALERLHGKRAEWAGMALAQRIALLAAVRERIAPVAAEWIGLSNQAKGLAPDSTLQGEEWTSGPWALLASCDQLLASLRSIDSEGTPPVSRLPRRTLPNGQLAVQVFPHSVFDRLLLSGVRSEVWMQPGVHAANLLWNVAAHYRAGAKETPGALGLVLGAGNISSIAPLDALYKLYAQKEVCLVKMNPVNDYLLPVFEHIFEPLAEAGYIAFVPGDGAAGAYLCNHALVENIHITGSQETHDLIVFGSGAEGQARRVTGAPLNPRPISSELGAVCPTIVVPGPWSRADIEYQAAHIATQKLHNSGFNCVACQVLVLPQDWEHTPALRLAVRDALAQAPDRKPYYPGAAARQEGMAREQGGAEQLELPGAQARREVIALPAPDHPAQARQREVFAPTLCEQLLPGTAAQAEEYLRRAIAYANAELHGTLGANIIIHPATRRALGERWDVLLQELRYGTIAVNAWTGLGYLLPANPWGAFPGHSLGDVQSGIGTVHNTFLFDRPQRAVVEAPFRPFPRSLLGGSMSLLPKPPWFVNNRRAHHIGRRLFAFQHRPSWWKLPGIFLDALRG